MIESASTNSALLLCDNISKHHGKLQVLSSVGFAVQEGEILGVIGPNGAGKTTLMECVTGLQPWDSGTMFWRGQPLLPLQAKQYCYYLPDGILPWANDRVGITLRFFQGIYGASNARLALLVERLGLEEMLTKPIYTLSKGFRRRLLLAIGLLAPQPLIMLDEPFDGFDLRQSLAVMDLLRELLAGRTLMLSIHQLSEAEKICDRFLLLDAGVVVALGSLNELRLQADLSKGGLEEVFLALV